MKVTKSNLYKWFFAKPMEIPLDSKLLEMFLIQKFDEEKGSIFITKAAIRDQTGLSKYLATKYVKALETSGEWTVERLYPHHTYTFTPRIGQKN